MRALRFDSPTHPAARPRARHRSIVLRLVLVACTAFLVAQSLSCASVVNASPGLRWWLFSNFGAERVCPEMMKTSVSLRMQDRAPGIGRFFPSQCNYNVNDDSQTLSVSIGGTGYAYLPSAKRVGFNMSVSVEYRPDFMISGDNLYVWGKFQRLVQGPNFQLGYVENKVLDVATAVTPLGSAANFLGTQVVTGFLTRGFTVVDNDDTGREFALGILNPPAKPFKPIEVTDEDAYTFANETLDVYVGQRDYLGPFEVADSDQFLQMRMNLTGSPIEMLVVQKSIGDPWREAYEKGWASPAPVGITAGAAINPGTSTRRFKVPPGLYYIVIDNTVTAGQITPPLSLNPLLDVSSRLSYVAQLVED